MERRSFLKFLAIAPLVPKVAVDILSKVAAVVPTHAQHVVAHQALQASAIAEQMKRTYGEAIVEHFKQRTMVYDRFCADVSFFKGKGKGYYVKLSD